MINNEEGFTLLETLLVLMVVSMLLSFPVIKINDALQTIQIDLFFRELSAKMTQYQTHAMLSGQDVEIRFIPGTQEIYFNKREEGTETLLEEEIWKLNSPYYELTKGAAKRITFKEYTGNITNAGYVPFKTVEGRYRLYHQMGSGRFDIREE